MLYPQNGDRIVTIDSVTSLRPMCRRGEWRRSCTLRLFIAVLRLMQRSRYLLTFVLCVDAPALQFHRLPQLQASTTDAVAEMKCRSHYTSPPTRPRPPSRIRFMLTAGLHKFTAAFRLSQQTSRTYFFRQKILSLRKLRLNVMAKSVSHVSRRKKVRKCSSQQLLIKPG